MSGFPHFVEDYRLLVKSLIAQHGMAKAMELAVGGAFETMGEAEYRVLERYGLKRGDVLIDVGCGSGRLAKQLSPWWKGTYLGTDVVPELLEHAKRGCPAHWEFTLVDGLEIPYAQCADMVSFFSVFTHLLPEESFLYLEEAKRVLRPDGVIVFSFLDYECHRTVFNDVVEKRRSNTPRDHLVTFLATETLEVWASKLGLEVVDMELLDSEVGQAVCVMRVKRA